MDRADPRAGEHRRRRFGDHRHVDHHPVAALDAALLQQVGEAAGLFVELAIGELWPCAGLVRLEDQRGAVAMFGEMPVEAIDRQIELAVRVPADVEIVLVERPVAGFRRKLVPGQPPRLVEPEPVGIGVGEIVQLGELGGPMRALKPRRNGMDGFAHRPRLMSITKR